MSIIESFLCGDTAFFFILSGGLFLLSVVIALLTTILPRERLAHDVQALSEDNPLAFISPDIAKFRHSFQIKLPRCAVVMPIKGVHDQSYDNWRSQITSMYGGPLDFYFCIESADDPANEASSSATHRVPLLVIICCTNGLGCWCVWGWACGRGWRM